MIAPDQLARRSNVLIERARFMTLATQGPSGAWAATVNYVPLRAPLRLLWYSLRSAEHSVNIEMRPEVSGSVYLSEADNELGLDGAQFTAAVEVVESDRLEELSGWYYERNFPDQAVRRRWMLPLNEFRDDGSRRFYLLTVRQWWLLDIDGWLRDKNDRRVQVPLDSLSTSDVSP